MTNFPTFIGALAVSLLSVFYLVYIDEKRARAFRLRRRFSLPRSPILGWAIVFIPGLVLIGMAQVSAFLAWFGALTVASWLISAKTPDQVGK